MCARAALILSLVVAGLSGIALFWLGVSAALLHVVFLAAAGAALALGVFSLGRRLLREGSELADSDSRTGRSR